jgi:hypothetical protein
MYKVPTKMNPKKLPPSRNPTAFAPATDRFRNIRSGSSGASTRASTRKNATSSAPETASELMVFAAAQPSCGAVEIA